MGRDNKGGKPRKHTGGRFIQIDFALLESAAWRSLTPSARAVYVELLRLHNGMNNGEIGLSVNKAGDALGKSKTTGARALQELQDKGFIVPTTPSSFGTNGRRAAEWRITALNVARFGKPKLKILSRATRDFMGWTPDIKENHSSTGGTLRPVYGKNPPKLRVVGG